MKGAHPQIARFIPDYFGNPFFHLSRCLVGEGEGENVEWISSFFDQMSNTVGEYSGFSGTGAGDDHHGTLSLYHCFTLHFVELVEVILHGLKIGIIPVEVRVVGSLELAVFKRLDLFFFAL